MRALLRHPRSLFEPDPHPVTASSNPAPTVALPKRTLKYYQQLLVGAHIAYSSAEHPDRTFRVGKVTHLMQAELSCAVHRMGAQQDGRLRVRFQLLYIDAEGMETTSGVKPSIEQVPSTRLIREIHLLPKGDMWHSEARALNQQNWRMASTSLSAPCDPVPLVAPVWYPPATRWAELFNESHGSVAVAQPARIGFASTDALQYSMSTGYVDFLDFFFQAVAN